MQYFLSFIFFHLLLISIKAVVAQSQDTSALLLQKDRYIERMTDYLSLKVSATDNIEGFVVRTTAVKYDLRPNDKTAVKLSFNYRFISFNISTTPKFIPGNNDNQLKGKSKYSNFSLGFNFNRWVQGLSYTRARGYYLENTRDYRQGWREGTDPYAQFPDLVYQSFQGQTAYKLNKNFSFNALNVQTERQLKRAGTLMPFLSYRYYIVDDRTPLTGQAQSQKSNNFETVISLAYYYTFVARQKFYASAGLAPGAGIIFSKLVTRSTTESITTRYNNPIYRVEGGIALGYNSERFFAGAQLTASSAVYSRKKVVNIIENERASYQLFVGYRFGAPGFLKRILDQAEEKESQLLRKK